MDARSTEFAVAEAKSRFSELLARAEAGEEITIKRHGRVVAKLVPAKSGKTITDPEARRKLVDEWFASRRDHGPRLGPDLTIKDLINEGRKY